MKLTLLTILLICPMVIVSLAPQSFRDEVVQRHNELRAKHQVGPVKENSELTLFAQEWADYLARNNVFEHRDPNQYGENLAWRSDGSASGKVYVDQLYEEEEKTYREKGFYDIEPTWDDLNSNTVGHFTQIVWKASTEIGIGKAGGYVVINYKPRGNYFGQYKENVFKPSTGNGFLRKYFLISQKG